MKVRFVVEVHIPDDVEDPHKMGAAIIQRGLMDCAQYPQANYYGFGVFNEDGSIIEFWPDFQDTAVHWKIQQKERMTSRYRSTSGPNL